MQDEDSKTAALRSEVQGLGDLEAHAIGRRTVDPNFADNADELEAIQHRKLTMRLLI